MTKQFIETWIELIRPLFPPDVKIETDEENGFILRINWKLKNDRDRPNKPSRLIRVIISEEAIEDCNNFNKAGSRFREVIENKLSTFNPEHDNPRDLGPPIEEWEISTFDLN